MPIEKDIIEAIKKFTFNKKLPEFIDMAKHLEGRLKEGENLSVRIGKLRTFGPICYTIYLELQKTKGKPRRVIRIDSSGDLKYRANLFKDYKPLPESQRKR